MKRVVEEEEKLYNLFQLIEGNALKLFTTFLLPMERYTNKIYTIQTLRALVWNVLKKCPTRGVTVALETCLDGDDLSESIETLHSTYNHANLNDLGRYGLLCKNVGKVQGLVQFALYCKPKSYQKLRDVVDDNAVGLKFSKSGTLCERTTSSSSKM